MPELPDITIYVERLSALVVGRALEGVRLWSPFLLRSVDPPIEALRGRPVEQVRRLGKRVVLCFSEDHYLVIHLMIAGRLRWRPPGAGRPGKAGLAALDFAPGTLLLTEAGTRRRASLHVVRGAVGLAAHDRGGVEVLECTPAAFAEALRRESRTLKRALTDPALFSGIGNACSDEILHRARLSPAQRTRRLDDEQVRRLHEAARAVLGEWLERLRAEAGDGLPEKVTAFKAGMAVHGRFGKPCPACGGAVQRIVHRDGETNYCPACQTGGRVLSDRSLSRLLRRGEGVSSFES